MARSSICLSSLLVAVYGIDTLPPMQHHSLFRNVPPLLITSWVNIGSGEGEVCSCSDTDIDPIIFSSLVIVINYMYGVFSVLFWTLFTCCEVIHGIYYTCFLNWQKRMSFQESQVDVGEVQEKVKEVICKTITNIPLSEASSKDQLSDAVSNYNQMK